MAGDAVSWGVVTRLRSAGRYRLPCSVARYLPKNLRRAEAVGRQLLIRTLNRALLGRLHHGRCGQAGGNDKVMQNWTRSALGVDH